MHEDFSITEKAPLNPLLVLVGDPDAKVFWHPGEDPVEEAFSMIVKALRVVCLQLYQPVNLQSVPECA